MPQWVELLINICAFVGFVGIATYWAKTPTDMRR
jgi:hypothetical protein